MHFESSGDDDVDLEHFEETLFNEDLHSLVRKSYLLYIAYQTMAVPLTLRKKHRKKITEVQSETESDIETYAKRLKTVCEYDSQGEYAILREDISYQDENEPLIRLKTRRSRRRTPPLKALELSPTKASPPLPAVAQVLEIDDRIRDCRVVLSRLSEESIARYSGKANRSSETIGPCENAEIPERMETVRRILSMVVSPFLGQDTPVPPEEDPLSSDESLKFEELFGPRNNPRLTSMIEDDEKTRAFWESRRKLWVTDYREDVREFLGFEPSSGVSESSAEETEPIVTPREDRTGLRKHSTSSGTRLKAPKWQQRPVPQKISFSRRSGRAVKPPELVDV